MYKKNVLDYCLFVIFFQENIKTYGIIGDYFELHARVSDAMEHKDSKKQKYGELVLIYKKPKSFIEQYWKETLKPETKWLIIVPQNVQDAQVLFREIREFGESYLVIYPEPIILIKNIRHNFKELYRVNFLAPLDMPKIDDFLNLEILEKNDKDCAAIYGSQEEQITRTMVSKAQYIYFGHPTDQLLKLKMFSKLKFHIIECIDMELNKTVGFFVHREYLNKAWLYNLTNYDSLATVFKFKEIGLKIGV